MLIYFRVIIDWRLSLPGGAERPIPAVFRLITLRDSEAGKLYMTCCKSYITYQALPGAPLDLLTY